MWPKHAVCFSDPVARWEITSWRLISAWRGRASVIWLALWVMAASTTSASPCAATTNGQFCWLNLIPINRSHYRYGFSVSCFKMWNYLHLTLCPCREDQICSHGKNSWPQSKMHKTLVWVLRVNHFHFILPSSVLFGVLQCSHRFLEKWNFQNTTRSFQFIWSC